MKLLHAKKPYWCTFRFFISILINQNPSNSNLCRMLTQFVPLHFHRSLPATLLLILGICSASSQTPVVFLVGSAGALISTAIFYFHTKDAWGIIYLSTAFFGGTAVYHWKCAQLQPSYSLENISVEAEIQEKEQTGNPHWPERIKLKASRIQGQTVKPFTFFVYCKHSNSLEHGDKVKCSQMNIKLPSDQNFKRYINREGAIGTVFSANFCPQVQEQKRWSFSRWLARKRNLLFSNLKKKMPKKTFALFSSLFMGDRARVKQAIEPHKSPFKWWGISHHLARSGLHLMLFIALLALIMSFLPIPFFYKSALTTLLSCVYFVLTPSTISFVRAFQLFLFYRLCNFLSLPIHSVHLLCLACIFTLIYNPFQLFFLDFQLSFYLAFCLAWLAQLNRTKKLFI